MHFLYYIPLFILCSSFQGTFAFPVHDKNDHSTPSSPETISGWRFLRVISFWNGHRDGSEMENEYLGPEQHLETINIPEPYSTPEERIYNNLNQPPIPEGMFPSLGELDRVLTPVGILVAMVWLGLLASGLVAIVDYVWMRWGRDYSGYSSYGNVEGEELRQVEEGVENRDEVKLEMGVIIEEEDELL